MRKSYGNISSVTPGDRPKCYVISLLLRDTGAQKCNDVCTEGCHCVWEMCSFEQAAFTFKKTCVMEKKKCRGKFLTKYSASTAPCKRIYKYRNMRSVLTKHGTETVFFFNYARITLSRNAEEPNSMLVLGKSTCDSWSSFNPKDRTECTQYQQDRVFRRSKSWPSHRINHDSTE
jgi:hypothetical protein